MSTTTSTAERLPVLDEPGRNLLFTQARTADSFSDEAVTDEQLREIHELSKFGPTSANINPLRIVFVRPGESRDRLVALMNEGNRAKTASAPVVAILADDFAFHERIPELFPIRPQMADMFAGNDELRESSARYNGALQAGYFILAIRAVGLAAGPMIGFDKAGVDREFLADTDWRSQLVVNLGHPGIDPWFDRLPRPSYDSVVRHV